MKKGLLKKLIICLPQFMVLNSAMAYNQIEITVSSSDLSHYKEKPEKYKFADAQFKLNDGGILHVEELETRGQGSIFYQRKNFGLKLEQKIRIGRIESKKIDLLSMSADPGYISTRLGLMTAELLKIGVPLPTEYAEVKINGVSNGLYTLVEKPKAALDKSPYVVRRGYRSRFITEEAEISRTLTTVQVSEIRKAAQSIYTTVATKKGSELFLELKQKMDIDAYMRWMVMNSLYTNGDFPDEIFFYVDAEMYKQGRIFFRVMPWDFDDLFKTMHNAKRNEIETAKPENKFSILYSYEDNLDLSFSPANAYMYDQLKTTARQLLAKELSQSNTDTLLNQIHSEISEYLKNAEILRISSEDSARKGVSFTQDEIEKLFLKRKKQIDARRAILLERIDKG
ncbi:MAG: CotH kinase family protein [Bdellovibrio sp.]